jgi:hypothetical protein
MLRHIALAAYLAVIPAAVAFVAVPGCTQPAVPTSVIGAAQVVAQTAATIVSDAQAVWPIVLSALPAASQAAAQDAFNKAIFAANHAILALNDAIQVAIAANTPNPDFTAMLSQVADAVGQVVSIIQNFQATSPAIAEHLRSQGGVDAVSDLNTASVRLKVLSAKKP